MVADLFTADEVLLWVDTGRCSVELLLTVLLAEDGVLLWIVDCLWSAAALLVLFDGTAVEVCAEDDLRTASVEVAW